jgi:hypothetical protein
MLMAQPLFAAAPGCRQVQHINSQRGDVVFVTFGYRSWSDCWVGE